MHVSVSLVCKELLQISKTNKLIGNEAKEMNWQVTGKEIQIYSLPTYKSLVILNLEDVQTTITLRYYFLFI